LAGVFAAEVRPPAGDMRPPPAPTCHQGAPTCRRHAPATCTYLCRIVDNLKKNNKTSHLYHCPNLLAMSKRILDGDDPSGKRMCTIHLPCIDSTLDGMPASLLERIAIVAGPSAFRALSQTNRRIRNVLNQIDVQWRARDVFVQTTSFVDAYGYTVTTDHYPNVAYTCATFEKNHPNGKIRQRYYRVGGKLSGTNEAWDDTGARIFCCNYVDGNRHGITERWNRAGNRVSSINYRQGLRHGVERIWNDAGVCTYIIHWANDRHHGIEEMFNDAGVLRYRARRWIHGKSTGTKEEWDDEGRRTCLVHWVDSKRHGTEERWNGAGIRIYCVHWNNGKKHGIEERWNNAGNRVHRMNWKHDAKNGTERRWNDAGECTHHVQWKNDVKIKPKNGKTSICDMFQ